MEVFDEQQGPLVVLHKALATKCDKKYFANRRVAELKNRNWT
jgi:hypothetical protein